MRYMTIEQTIEIPADRRIFLDVPATISAGRVTIAFIADEEEQRIRNALKRCYHAAGNDAAENRESLSACIGSHPGFFGGDGVAYQRKLRDEWDE